MIYLISVSSSNCVCIIVLFDGIYFNNVGFVLFIINNESPYFLQRAGLHPTAEQIELFAYHLPKATLSNVIVSTSLQAR